MTAEQPAITLDRPDVDWIRDGYRRPIILPDPRWLEDPGKAPAAWRTPDGGVWPDRRYTRVTTFGEALLDGSALSRWKMRRVALGMGRRPDYVTAAAALTAEDRDRAALNDLAEKALEAAGPNAADIGTALHQFTERMDRGEDLGFVPPEYRADLDAYRQAVAPLTMLRRECRMVCDQLETAGTPDAIVLCSEPDPDGVTDVARIADLKTGNVDYTAGKFSTQLAIYAHSDLYDPATGERTGLELSHRWGLVVHMPAGLGTAQLRWLRLDHGWAGAQLAGPVREWRKLGARELARPVFLPAGVQWSDDGKCLGTKRDGERCTYRATDNGFCSRHQAQARGDAPVATGDPAAVPDPQLEADALEARTQDVTQQVAVMVAAELIAPSTAGDNPVEQQPTLEHVLDGYPPASLAYAAEIDQWCDRTGTSTDDPAVRAAQERHRVAREQLEQQPATEPMTLDRPDRDPADVPGGAAFGPLDVDPEDPEQQAWLAARPDRDDQPDPDLTRDLEPIVEDPPEDPATEHTQTGDRCLHSGLLVEQCACAVHRPDLAGVRDDGAEPDDLLELHLPRPSVPPLPYRAPDPMDPNQLQGNPRPHSGMSTPEGATAAAHGAEWALLRQVAGCVAPTELELLFAATGHAWTPAVRDAASAKRAELQARPQLERTSAALWSAIRNAPTEGHLLQLWQDQALNPLWTDAHRAAAAARQAELRGT